MDIILDSDLASYLGQEVTPSLTMITDLVNDLFDESWTNPVDPIPARVTALALAVAARAAANPKGLTSWTRSWDDISRTERAEAGQRVGIYLTDDELDQLNGVAVSEAVPVGTIHTQVRGWPCW